MKVIADHLADPGSLGVMIGNASVPPLGVYVILHHKDSKKHRILNGATLEEALNGKKLDPLAELGL